MVVVVIMTMTMTVIIVVVAAAVVVFGTARNSLWRATKTYIYLGKVSDTSFEHYVAASYTEILKQINEQTNFLLHGPIILGMVWLSRLTFFMSKIINDEDNCPRGNGTECCI